MALIVAANRDAPPSARSSLVTDVMTAYFKLREATARATRFGSSRSSPCGVPFGTPQNRQLLVQTLPRIMNVTVPAFQHSVWFGHAALLQTVWRLLSLIRFRTVARRSFVVSRILNQGGRRFAFSFI
jgi:hypothetical protein